jgi:hypothetical protein
MEKDAQIDKPPKIHRFQYRLLPSTIKEELSVSIDGNPKHIDYGLSLIKEGGINLIWFDKLICRYKDRAYFEVIDVVEIPNIQQNEILILGNVCSINDSPDHEVIAIAEKEPTALQTKIKKAWRANRTSEHLETITIDGITCITDWADE